MRTDLREKVLTMLQENDDLFIQCVEELDSWNGYTQDFRAYPMDMLNDFYIDRTATDLISDLTDDFNINDDYFYYSIFGLESTDNIVELYQDNISYEEVLDEIIKNYGNIVVWGYPEFDDLLGNHLEELEE